MNIIYFYPWSKYIFAEDVCLTVIKLNSISLKCTVCNKSLGENYRSLTDNVARNNIVTQEHTILYWPTSQQY